MSLHFRDLVHRKQPRAWNVAFGVALIIHPTDMNNGYVFIVGMLRQPFSRNDCIRPRLGVCKGADHCRKKCRDNQLPNHVRSWSTVLWALLWDGNTYWTAQGLKGH